MASTSTSSDPHPEYAEVVVIRHGETAWNADGRFQGHLDIELNDVGRAQAAAVAERLSRELKVSVVYSSDLQRAYETARIIATKCGGLEVLKDPDLRERHLGHLQGITRREALQINPAACKAKDNGEEIPGGGESVGQLTKRCISALQRIGMNHLGKRVAVVTHGGVIRLLYKKVNTDSPCKIVRNASVNIFHLYKDKWIMKTWGDVSHLNQTGFLQSGFGGDSTSG